MERRTAMKIRRIICALLCAVLISTVFTGCSSSDGTGYGFSYSLTRDPANLDPQVATSNNALLVITNVFEGLMRIGPDGDLIYGVATEYIANDNFTEYTFYLRRDAMWSDGETPVTAYDFAFAWKRALDPMTKSTTANTLYCIKGAQAIHEGTADIESLGVTIIDAYTLKVTLEYPYEEFPLQTTKAQFMPCNQIYFESTGGHYCMEDDYIICNGPFFVEKWSSGNYVRLYPNEFYKGVNQPKPRVVYLGIRASNTDYYRLLTGETVEAAKIESQHVDELLASDYKTYSYTDCTWGLLFNTADECFSNAKVRLGFASAITEDDYIEHLDRNNTIAHDMIPPVTKLNGILYRELAGGGYKITPDPAGAYDTMKAGLTEIERGEMSKVTIICPDDENVVAMMQSLVEAWQHTLKQYVNIEPMSENEVENRVAIGDYQIALYNLAPSSDGPLAFLRMFTSTYPYNPAFLKSTEFDAYYNEAADKTNTEDILAPVVLAEQYLNRTAVFLPMFYETTYYATWDSVDGIYFAPFDGTADFTCAVCTE